MQFFRAIASLFSFVVTAIGIIISVLFFSSLVILFTFVMMEL